MIKRIGNLKLKSRIFLAPMHEINDAAFRMLCKKAGAALAYTGLINPQTKEKICLNDKPALQFACNSEKGIKEFIKKYDKRISLYDFNLGCPSPHAKSSKIGYFMTENAEAIEKILSEMKKSTKKPITLKIRKIENRKSLGNIIKIAEKYCDAIAVHPRTQRQGYSGAPEIEFARKVKKLTKLPVIYSGNITNKEEGEKMLQKFDFIMIGRAAIGNPSIFSDILGIEKKKIGFFDWLRLAKKIEGKKLSFSHIKFQAMNFTRGFEGAAKARSKLSTAKSEKEIYRMLKCR